MCLHAKLQVRLAVVMHDTLVNRHVHIHAYSSRGARGQKTGPRWTGQDVLLSSTFV